MEENNKVNLFDYVKNKIECYDEEYAIEQGINNLDDEDINNIVAEILNNQEIEDLVHNEIESYAGTKKYYNK